MIADSPASLAARHAPRAVSITPAGYAFLGAHAPLHAFTNPLREAAATFSQLSPSDRSVAAADALLWARDLALSLVPEAS